MKKQTRFSTVLVTGCGGDIGLGVGRILKESGLAGRLVGCDAGRDHAGPTVFDRCETIGRADKPGFPAQLRRLVASTSARLVIPTAEPELRRLCKDGLPAQIGGAPLITANARALEICFDKLATARFLKAAGLPSPWSEPVGKGKPRAYPCILKQRAGSGSRGIFVVEDAAHGRWLAAKRKGDLWQEYLRGDDEEYTCGLFRASSGVIRSIVFKRKLQGGLTGSGVVAAIPAIDRLLERIALALDLRGAINVQLRMTRRGPVVFEINPRFSSTVVFRHRLGFKDLLWSITDKLGRPLAPYKPPRPGTRFFRTAQEAFLEPGGK